MLIFLTKLLFWNEHFYFESTSLYNRKNIYFISREYFPQAAASYGVLKTH